ncbi:hypothetical protein ACQBAU_16230 [Propionibacteriaceae bacterium Y2011]
MPSRYELNPKLDRLRAVLAKAERKLHLAQPIRSADLYAEAERAVDALVERYQRITDEAEATHPDRQRLRIQQ